MLNKKTLNLVEIILIIAFASIPLLFTLPYRVNIFLSWEGAYRISIGQLPFKDFGLPLGGMYWVIPAIFFKIFGPQMITLIKAQVFINIVSGLAFRSILKSLSVSPAVSWSGILLYCISFSFLNFWPGYNHTVIVYAFVGLAFVVNVIMSESNRHVIIKCILGAVFTVFAFFTKQDGGGLIFLLCTILLLYNAWIDKKWKLFLLYNGSVVLFLFLIVIIFSNYDFGYWFNHGQPPHNARFAMSDVANKFFGESDWLKFYFFVIIILSIGKFQHFKSLILNKKECVSLLLTLGILCMAAIFQITSYTPETGNIFFHSFAFVFILNNILRFLPVNLNKPLAVIILSLGVFMWWSNLFWSYMQRIFIKDTVVEGKVQYSATGENVVGMHNSRLNNSNDGADIAALQGGWVNSNLKTLRKIKIPEQTSKGIDRLLNMDVIKSKKGGKILNMSELTFLAAEIPYTPEKGTKFPLWYHLGVGMFNREAIMFEDRIAKNYYDIVLFEYLPTLNNFYPFRVRDSLMTHYQKTDSFPAPRSTNPGTIEIYTRKE
ncbi:MAG: hypothetical protein IT249_00995 [Chitinophagaceae bacterium]|nr:hypothetical protein [Chitinophagaceae bacterium]